MHPIIALLQKAEAAIRVNRLGDAKLAFEQALLMDADCLDAYKGLARLRFPGESYIEILGHIHRLLEPRTYLEIGVAAGASLEQVLPQTRCIGIDPAPTVDDGRFPFAKIFRLTSEEFFKRHNARALLGGAPVEMGFIDGLHLFENVLEDFANLEKQCAPSGVILIHDCIPFDHITASREQKTQFWTGDVWRAVPTLAKMRPDLSLTLLQCAPTGLAVIRNLDPASQVLTKDKTKALAYGFGLDYDDVLNFPSLGIDVIPSDWTRISALFDNRALP